MFTGIVEAVGSLSEVKGTGGGYRVRIQTPLSSQLKVGDSLAVNGVCLTVIASDRPGVRADVSPETARVTTLGDLRPGAEVNLERSMRADARVGGHFVQGHVDATGSIEGIAQEGDSYRITIRFPAHLEPLLVHKGSVAVDGISLTIAALDGDRFDVQIIPHTWERTNLHAAAIGAAVNLECDILGKYVARALAVSMPPR